MLILYSFIIIVHCPLPILNDQVIVESDNRTEMGLILRFKCKHGLVPEEYVMSVCSGGGLWFPDPEEHICHPPIDAITDEFYPGVYSS